MVEKQPLLVVAGPTASGKTALSVRLAKALNGEVVSADSMQMYRKMDIGTAKPTREEMAEIPHHLIDVLDPGETFSVADYAAMARPVIREIGQRGRLPILTGGTGLYIDAIVEHIQFSPIPSDEGIRRELRELAEREGAGALFAILRECDPLRCTVSPACRSASTTAAPVPCRPLTAPVFWGSPAGIGSGFTTASTSGWIG